MTVSAMARGGRAILFLLMSASALFALGCGNGAGGIVTGEISKQAFLKKADTVCTETYNRVKVGFQAFVKGKSNPFSQPGEVKEFADTVLIPAKQQEVRRLRALGAPEGDGDEVEGILAAYEEGIERAEDDPQEAVSSAPGVFTKATDLSEAYGLKTCRY